MRFSLRYVGEVAYLFSRYPAAIIQLGKGADSAASYIDQSRILEYSRSPVLSKRAFGFEIFLNPSDKVGVSPSIGVTGLYEPHVTEFYRGLLRKGMVVVDVGANVGWYTMLAAKRASKVVSFEPDPLSFSLMQRSIARNRFSNVTAVQACVTDSVGFQRLYLATENLGGHSTVRRPGDSYIEVPSTSLGVALGEMGVDRIGILKIDAEGAEPQVVLGSKELLPRVENVIMEWNPEAWQSHSELLDELSNRFSLYELVRNPFLSRRISREDLSGLSTTNLYLRRRSAE